MIYVLLRIVNTEKTNHSGFLEYTVEITENLSCGEQDVLWENIRVPGRNYTSDRGKTIGI